MEGLLEQGGVPFEETPDPKELTRALQDRLEDLSALRDDVSAEAAYLFADMEESGESGENQQKEYEELEEDIGILDDEERQVQYFLDRIDDGTITQSEIEQILRRYKNYKKQEKSKKKTQTKKGNKKSKK
ncbi:MAG TPA: hypothetical protein VJC12_01755 [Candidatus Paceibacterota bacterium]